MATSLTHAPAILHAAETLRRAILHLEEWLCLSFPGKSLAQRIDDAYSTHDYPTLHRTFHLMGTAPEVKHAHQALHGYALIADISISFASNPI